jgi:hypothetical protein
MKKLQKITDNPHIYPSCQVTFINKISGSEEPFVAYFLYTESGQKYLNASKFLYIVHEKLQLKKIS